MEAIPNEMQNYRSIAGLNSEQILSIYNQAIDHANNFATSMNEQIELYYKVVTKLGQLSNDLESLRLMLHCINDAIYNSFDGHSIIHVISAMGWLATNGESQSGSIRSFVIALVNYKDSVLPIIKKVPSVAMYKDSNKSTISVLFMAFKDKTRYIASKEQLGLSEDEFNLFVGAIGAENSFAIALYYAKVNQLYTISDFLQIKE